MIGGFVDIFPSKVSLNPGYFFRVSSRVPRNPYLLAQTCHPVVVWKHAFNFQFRFYQVLSRYIKFYKVESNSSNAMKITHWYTIEDYKLFRNLSYLKLKISQDYIIMLYFHLNFTILPCRIFMKSPTHFLTFFRTQPWIKRFTNCLQLFIKDYSNKVRRSFGRSDQEVIVFEDDSAFCNVEVEPHLLGFHDYSLDPFHHLVHCN